VRDDDDDCGVMTAARVALPVLAFVVPSSWPQPSRRLILLILLSSLRERVNCAEDDNGVGAICICCMFSLLFLSLSFMLMMLLALRLVVVLCLSLEDGNIVDVLDSGIIDDSMIQYNTFAGLGVVVVFLCLLRFDSFFCDAMR
jgi:hypothetical protein